MNEIESLARFAKTASRRLAVLPTDVKRRALGAAADRIEADADAILKANAADRADAKELAGPLRERLKLDREKLAGMAAGIRAVAALEDPVGRLLSRTLLDDGLRLDKVSCPLGVLAVIFESRPDAVTQISSLALMSGNALILKGGREAARSTAALVASLSKAFEGFPGIPADALAIVTDRAHVDALLALDAFVDLVIPRGSNDLVRYIQGHTKIPVMGHADGVCHVYVDVAADTRMAVDIVADSKLQYPAACNAVETVLVHGRAAPRILPPLVARLREAGTEIRACARTRALLPDLVPATEDDWGAEYLAPVVAVKMVDSLDEAIEHVNRYGSSHTDAIVTDDAAAAERFLSEVDSAGVYHNASTRFADGFRYGFGAEVGISTSKLHARGPVGLDGLVSYKYKLYGKGQLVASYSGPGARPFRHEKIPS